jgi:hypothetical protein
MRITAYAAPHCVTCLRYASPPSNKQRTLSRITLLGIPVRACRFFTCYAVFSFPQHTRNCTAPWVSPTLPWFNRIHPVQVPTYFHPHDQGTHGPEPTKSTVHTTNSASSPIGTYPCITPSRLHYPIPPHNLRCPLCYDHHCHRSA